MSSVAGAPVLELAAVAGADALGPAGRARGRLAGVTLSLGPGLHAVVGAPEDGTLAFHELCAGRRRPTRGRLRVAAREPWRSATARAQIALLSPSAELPPGKTVSDALVRVGLDDVRARLERWGLAALGERAPAKLSDAEARAVELALALEARSPALLLLHEPWCDVALGDRSGQREKLRALAEAGACVLITTSSADDARALCDTSHRLERGELARDEVGWGAAHRSEIVVWLGGDPAPLAAALSARSEVEGVGWERADGDGALAWLLVRAADLEAAALAVAEEGARLGVALGSLRVRARAAETAR